MTWKKMDMHVHSCFSVEPVPRVSKVNFRPKETPEEIYQRAKAAGMDFVTITDHDTIDGCLDFLSRHPEAKDFVVGEEVSTQLPVSKLTVHINVYGHNEAQHRELQKRREDAFAVAAYCREQGLFFAWNHPFYRENLSTIEAQEFLALVDKVDVLETRNGGRMQTLNVLAEELAVRFGKGMQGGSDTHTGHVGTVYTAVPCQDIPGFFAGILQGQSRIVGHHSTPRTFLVHNFLVGRRHVIDQHLRQASSAMERLRLKALGALALALSPWIVRRHFSGQREMVRLAVSRLPELARFRSLLTEAA
ncbi:MAG: PHP-associated domain-containing protein [Thermoanaerobaculum sp.]